MNVLFFSQFQIIAVFRRVLVLVASFLILQPFLGIFCVRVFIFRKCGSWSFISFDMLMLTGWPVFWTAAADSAFSRPLLTIFPFWILTILIEKTRIFYVNPKILDWNRIRKDESIITCHIPTLDKIFLFFFVFHVNKTYQHLPKLNSVLHLE